MVEQNPHRCAFPWQQMIIDPTGDVTPCCYYHSYSVGRHNAALGNTNESTIDEIWHGPGYRELRRIHVEGVPEGHPCDNCVAYKFNNIYPRFDTSTGVAAENGHCFIVKLTKETQKAIAESQHEVEFWEGDRRIATQQSSHDEIREQGGGRYSIAGNVVYFSTSDGVDPIVSGRKFELRAGNQTFPIPAFGYDRSAPSAKNMQTAYKEYHDGATTVSAKPSLLGFASSVDCNIDCGYCSQNQFRAAKLQLRDSTHDQVIDLVPYLSYLIWAGGEPFFLKPFRDFVDNFDRDSNPNLLFGFTTNGTMTTASELKKLESKFTRVQASFSIDSFVPETYEFLRKGAKFDRVIKNFLSANERNDGLYWLVQCGLLVMKANMREIDQNIKFAIDNSIELNLSPILQYPVDERLDIFTNFEEDTEGWQAALETALAYVETAKAEKRLSYDVSGPLRVLLRGLDESRERYADPLWVEVMVRDPNLSLQSMRNPGVIVGSVENPLGYAVFKNGAGAYRLQVPRDRAAEISSGEEIEWGFFQDIVEPWMALETGMLKIGGQKHDMLGAIELTPDNFQFEFRERNAKLANHGEQTAEGILNTDGSQLHFAVRAYELERIAAARSREVEEFSEEIEKTNLTHEFGNCFLAPIPPSIPSRHIDYFRFSVCENGKPLRAPRAPLDDIRNWGEGRYARSGDTVYFSASDNTNPQSNGRIYTLVQSRSDPPVDCEETIRRVRHQEGHCFVGFLPPEIPSDQDGQSTIVVLEDGAPLSTGHAEHDDIREKGRGRYSHWGDHIYFSASDNTDPTANGRTYTVVDRTEHQANTVVERTECQGPVGRMRHHDGHCFLGFIPPDIQSDEDGLSRVTILEDSEPLRLGHAYHQDICDKGNGRYSHWADHIYFSASDNTDPRSNGRTYTFLQFDGKKDIGVSKPRIEVASG